MASIEARKTPTRTTYRVTWRQDGRRPSETFATRAEALRFQADVIAAGEQWPEGWVRGFGYNTPAPEAERIAAPTTAITTRQASPTLLAEAVAYTAGRHTKAGPEHRIKMRREFERHLAGDLGDTPVDEVTRAQIQEWLDDQAERYAFKTIKTRRASLGAVFRVWCREHGGANPVDGTRNDGAESVFEPVFLQPWEVDAIVEHLPTEADRVYVEVLVGTGMRKGEALALRVGDLDLYGAHPAIRIVKARKHGHDGVHRIGTTKTRSSRRTVTIDAELTEMLRSFTAGRAGSETLFDLGNEGTWQNNHWAPARAKARLADSPRIHDLRHTHASWLLAEGMPLFSVSKRLGHADIQTTANIYGHLDQSTDIAAAASIGRMRHPETAGKLRLV